MKYDNANDVLPEELLKEVQKYAAGKLLYIPSGDGKRAWGETSGYRDQLLKRNLMIRNKYSHGMTISELADEYFLSLDSIKKIIYSKKHDLHVTYTPTLASAVQYANVGMLQEWVQCYLQLTIKDTPVIDYDTKKEPIFFGVVKFPLRLIQRFDLELLDNYAQEVVGANMEIDTGAATLPPLLIHYVERKFYCSVQKELFAALVQHKVKCLSDNHRARRKC